MYDSTPCCCVQVGHIRKVRNIVAEIADSLFSQAIIQVLSPTCNEQLNKACETAKSFRKMGKLVALKAQSVQS